MDAFWLMSMQVGLKGATLKVYPGAPHGLTGTYKDDFTTDLPGFIKS
ncbi:hypothetical protein [Actinomadura sp. B10D3]